MKFIPLIILLGLSFALCSCHSNTKKEIHPPAHRLSFLSIKGIKYYEVKRRFSNGLSFNEFGFQQEPSWIIQFASNDSVLAYSPQNKKMQAFYLLYDHGNVYNFAKEWFRIKQISKDSLIMQRLQLNNKVIAKDIRSDVNIVYYAKNYIENTLKTTAEMLQRPSRADTAFIKALADKANRNPANRDSAFAARQPVTFTPLSNLITVEKISSVDVLASKTEAYDYLYPRYRIVINKAYKDFAYEFTVVVDKDGKMYLGSFYGEIPEYHEVRKKVLKGIISVYLQNLLKVKPGSTLGILHSSEITVNVTGKANPK